MSPNRQQQSARRRENLYQILLALPVVGILAMSPRSLLALHGPHPCAAGSSISPCSSADAPHTRQHPLQLAASRIRLMVVVQRVDE